MKAFKKDLVRRILIFFFFWQVFFFLNILKRTKLMTRYNQAVNMRTALSGMQQRGAFSAAIWKL